MARKMMQKEVTKTTVKAASINVVDGTPVLENLEDQTLLGNVPLEKAQKELNRKFGKPVTILEVQPETNMYEMEVEEFIKHASIKEPSEQQELDV